MKSSSNSFFNTKFNARLFAGLITLLAALMLMSVRAFMQEQVSPAANTAVEQLQTRPESQQIRTPLGPGVALTYPEMDVDAQPAAVAPPNQPNNDNEKLFIEAGQQTSPPRLSPASVITCNGAGGNWSAAGTWTGGVPTGADDVTIQSGCTVTIDTPAVALSVNVQSGGVLQYDSGATRTLTVGQSVTIDSGGTFQSAATGTVTNHLLSVGGNLTNNGTLDFSTNANTAGADITFAGPTASTFGGSGATTDIRTITVIKPASTVEVTTTNFTVQGTTTDGAPMAFATLTLGTLKISGSFTVTGRVFTAAGYTIPVGAGFWLNNPNFTVAGQAGSPTNNGVLRVSAGTFNMGTVGTNVMGAGAGAIFDISGGTMNVSGRLTSASAVTYTQSAGTVNICTAGGCTTSPSFGFTSTLPTNVMNMSGGTINMVNSNTLTTADYNQQGTINFTGGTVQFGTAATTGNFNFRMQGNAPNVVIDNTTNNKILFLSATSYVYGNFTVSTGTTLRLNNVILNMLGSTFTNNGTVTDGLTSGFTTSRLQFSGAVAQTYTGTGTMGTAADPIFGFSVINRGSGVTIDPSVSLINVARLLAFSGSLINTNKINLLQVGTNVMVIQRGGVPYLPTGTIDVAPTIPIPTFLILVYSQATTPTTTGVEIPASRTIRSLQEFNTNGVTLAGGPLTSTGTGGAAPDSLGLLLGGTTAGVAGGPLNTSAANLLTIASPLTGALLGGSENSYVNGPIARVLPASLASGSTYVFPVGKSMYKGFELVNPTTNAGGTVTVQAEVFDADSGGTNGAGLDGINHNRYWNAQIISGAANFTNSSVRVTELNSTGNALGQSATQGGAYASVGGTLAAATVQSLAATTPLGFFAVGRLTGTTTFPGGTYTVGTGGTYTNLTAAMADLSGKLITGPIVYSLLATYTSAGETFPIVVPRNGGSNASNTITIKPASGVTATISGTSTSMLRINDSYVTIDGSNTVGGTTRDLTIQNNSNAINTAAIWVSSQGTSAGATNVTLKNMNIRSNGGGASATTTIFGIFAGGTAVGTNGDNNDFLTIQNNSIDTAAEAIAVRALNVLNGVAYGLNINNNLIGSSTPANFVTFRGIEIIGAVVPYITKNEIFNQQTTTVANNIAGIELGSTVYYAQVTRNKVHDIVNNEPTQWGAFGISISTSTNNFGNSIINNAIWSISSFGFSTSTVSFDPVGIHITGGAGHKVYFNSVNMTGTKSVASNSAAFAADSTTDQGLDLRDNVFANAITGPAGSKAYASFVTTATAFGTSANIGFGTINYNDYYSTGTGNVANFLNFYGVDHTTLTAWRSSTQNDVNSLSVDPQFISASNLDLPGASPMVGAGQTIAGVTFDILGRGRANPPTIGAYEPLGLPTAAPANIMGLVTTGDGAPLGGVVMTLNSSDGERTTITSASGRYLFDNVSVGQLYLLTPMRVNYNFSPGVQSFSLLGNKTDADFTANATAVVGNPLETHDFFIRQNYLDFMGREPDQGGLDFWGDKIKACGSDSACILRERINISAEFFMSQEFQDTGSYVYRMYRASFGAHPTYAQFTPDRARVIGGSGLEQSKQQFADEWVTRSRFLQAYPSGMTEQEFINKLFDTAGLVPFIAERQAFINSMQSGQTRAQIVRGVAELGAFKAREYNSGFVLMQYFGYLRRDPDQGGYDFWLNVLDNREPNNYRGMVCSFLTSAEYQQRFSSVVIHSNAECGQ
ncbi:MAG: hypothetical protein WBP93_17535 [Pyrinomonadaceae bacterium]